MKQAFLLVGLMLAAAAVAALALTLARTPPAALPQMTAGGDFLSAFLGDAREVLSEGAVHKADSYFHGGVDEAGDYADEADGGGDRASAGSHHAAKRWRNTDPWRWINLHVRAPQEHRHLEGEASRELIPWLWVSVKMNPHNVEAWTTAIYVAWAMIKDRQLAMRVLEEGEKANPESAELAIERGRMLYDLGRGDLKAAAAAMLVARELMLSEYGPDPSQYELERRRAFEYIENVIKKCEAAPQAQ